MPAHIEYLYLPAVDSESFDISQYFEAACGLMQEELPRTNVLVHCMAGVSRSATLIIAYLMRSQGLPFADAFRLVKRRRKIVRPAERRSPPTLPSSSSSSDSRPATPPSQRPPPSRISPPVPAGTLPKNRPF